MTAAPDSYYRRYQELLLDDNLLELDMTDVLCLEVLFTNKLSKLNLLTGLRGFLRSCHFKCKWHNKYKVKIEPRSTSSWPLGCTECWKVYHCKRFLQVIEEDLKSL